MNNINKKMSINIIDNKFLNYNIRSCIIVDVQMYLVSDLLRQYNEINNTNKQFSDYLKNKQTQELLKFYKNDIDPENSLDQYEKFDIPNVIKYIIFKNNNFGGVNKGYVVCEELLISCLMWCDPIFATQIYSFIKNLRNINNDRFTEIVKTNKDNQKQIELLQEQVKRLQNRYIVNKNSQQWTYVLKIVKGNDGFYDIYSTYTKSEYEKENIMNREYYVRNIPNGYTFRYFIYEHLLPIIDQYNGVYIGNHRSHFKIQENLYDENDTHLDYLIRNAIDQTINELCWKI